MGCLAGVAESDCLMVLPVPVLCPSLVSRVRVFVRPPWASVLALWVSRFSVLVLWFPWASVPVPWVSVLVPSVVPVP